MNVDLLKTARPAAWRSFAVTFVAAILGFGVAAIGFVAATDPYGLRAAPGRPPGPLMDSNQRFLYPQIVRGGAYDSAVIGSSTARLLDPVDLDRVLGGRFSNLAMNAATPFEQAAMVRLVLARRAPRTLLFALDSTWCEGDAEARRRSGHPFPAWLYEIDAPFAVLRQVNWQSVVTGTSVVLHRLGLMPERIRGDGYAIFTPPEASYDAVRAARHIYGGTAIGETETARDEVFTSDAMPALAWLDALLAETPSATTKLVAFMPVHVAAQGRPGTPQGTLEASCKEKVAEIGRRRGAMVMDFRIPSPTTALDANYWDRLHYRLPVAARIVAALDSARKGEVDDAEDFFRVLTPATSTPKQR